MFAHCFDLQLRHSARYSKISRFPAGCMYRPESRSRSLHTPHIEIQDCTMTQTRSTRCASTISTRKTSTVAPALSIRRFQTMYFLTEFTLGALCIATSFYARKTNSPNSPGRWFASAGMKLVLINLLERYEIRFEKGKSKPRGISFQASFTPNMTAKIQLRRRRDS